jgi:hypothetical protein
MFRALLVLVVSMHVAGANAQTAEGAVALITQGLEAGRATGNMCGDIQAPKVTGRSPAKYRFDCGKGEWFETVFRQIDGCKYETFVSEKGKEPDRRDVLDFSKFRGLSPASGDATKTGHFFEASPDFCMSSNGKTCIFEFVSMASGKCCVLSGQVPRERVEAALSLLTKQCKP